MTDDDRRLSYRRWRELRTRILDRDGRVCWICGRPGADTVDHVVPRSRGGTDHPSNLRAAHAACNTAKHDRVVGVPITSRTW